MGMFMQTVKAVVVDDSAVYRMLLNNALSEIPGVTVVGRCKDGQDVVETIRKEKPDLLTLDVEMPVMDGLSTLREIKKLAAQEAVFQHVKVVMVSSLTKKGTDITIQGLNEGAIECIPKPEEGNVGRNKEVLSSLLQKVVDLVRADWSPLVSTTKVEAVRIPEQKAIRYPGGPKPVVRPKRMPAEAVLIGVSTGGPAALNAMLPDLCARTNLPILIVQHMPAGFTKSLADSLAKKCERSVVEATDGELVKERYVYIAPGGRHMAVQKDAQGVRIMLQDGAMENGCRPAVDVLFRSSAEAYGGKVVAAILTGMGADGTKGAKALHDLSVPILVQDQSSSVVWGMPGSAVDAGIVDEILPLSQMAAGIEKVIKSLH